MLIDEVTIRVKAGKGGDGIASFRREKYVPKGGPDGGDGGRGGDVVFQVKQTTHGLSEFAMKKEFYAYAGQAGMGKKKSGKSAEDLVVIVPPGTAIYEQVGGGNERLFADLKTEGETLVVARGGKGGLGNIHFATSTNQAPREFTPGAPGEEHIFRLELRLIADVGIIGLPNAGKSTFLARVSAARPKIADYPFTTLEPNLGVADVDGFRFVLADIPGLIEGAAEGKGLGHEFLKHVLRTKLLIHFISAADESPMESYNTIRKELASYDQNLGSMPELVVITKSELLHEQARATVAKLFKKHSPLFISSATGQGVQELLYAITRHLEKANSVSIDE